MTAEAARMTAEVEHTAVYIAGAVHTAEAVHSAGAARTVRPVVVVVVASVDHSAVVAHIVLAHNTAG